MTKKKHVKFSEIIDAEKLKNGLDIYTNINNNRKVIGKAPLSKDEKNDLVSLNKTAESIINISKEMSNHFYKSVIAFKDLAQKISYQTRDIILPEYERCYQAYNAGLIKLGYFIPKDFNDFFYWYLSLPENEHLTLGSIKNFNVEDFGKFNRDMVMRLKLASAEFEADNPEQSTNPDIAISKNQNDGSKIFKRHSTAAWYCFVTKENVNIHNQNDILKKIGSVDTNTHGNFYKRFSEIQRGRITRNSKSDLENIQSLFDNTSKEYKLINEIIDNLDRFDTWIGENK
jgi:hypothetical protein